MKAPLFKITQPLWRNLLFELRGRGGGERESGAFLLGKPGTRQISSLICYDDLDKAALETGIITFHAVGFVRLWEFCQQQGLKVLADVHTHPTDWTGQSESDKTHPMVAVRGHIALILPDFAAPNLLPFNGASVYEYLGSHKWKTHKPKSAPIQFTDL
jgi:proteasome lid subunit RPN8/RPN11